MLHRALLLCPLLTALLSAVTAADSPDPGPASLEELRASLGSSPEASYGRLQAVPLQYGELNLQGHTFIEAQYATPALALLALRSPSTLSISDRYLHGCWTFELGSLPAELKATVIRTLSLIPAPAPDLKLGLTAATMEAEASAVATLKSGILPAEVQYQAGSYTDQDGNGIGEYGLFPEMAGKNKLGQNSEITLNLLAPEFAALEPVVEGYHFKIYLPASDTSALSSNADTTRPQLSAKDAQGITLQEHLWRCYAWPGSGVGNELAIDQSGNVYQRPYPGTPPAWNDLTGGTWKDFKPTADWTQRRHARSGTENNLLPP